jgi:HlyD family secretion protein
MTNSKSRRRKKLLVFSVILLVLAGGVTLAVFKRREPFITVQVEKAAKRNLTENVKANGRIQPVLTVKISPEVSGEIIELPVKEGQTVKKNDLLVKIKPDLYEAQVRSSEAAYQSSLARVATAEASLKKTESEFKRFEELFKNQLISESVYTEAKTALEIGRAELQSATHQVEMSRAALARNQEDLRKTTIRSPLDGTIIRLNSQLGERVVGTAMMAGTEVMVIADLNEMEARVDIGEIDVILAQVGQQARLEVDAYKERKFSGAVTEIANSSRGLGFGGSGGGQSQDATKYEVKIRIKDKEAFRPGMSVTADIETRHRTNALTVPIAAVTTRLPKEPKDSGKSDKGKSAKPANPGKETKPKSASTNQSAGAVASTGNTNSPTSTSSPTSTNSATSTNTVSGKKTNGARKPIEVVFVKEGDVVKMVPVKSGISDDDYMEIIEGLKEGQEVVSGGYKAVSRELEDGKKVRIGTSKPEESKAKRPQP